MSFFSANFTILLYAVVKMLDTFFCIMVGSSGLEPPTSRLSGARSNQLSYEPFLPTRLGGDERVRTAGLLLARQALSQLSYTPASASVLVVVVSHSIHFSRSLYLENRTVLNELLARNFRLSLRSREKIFELWASRP